MKKPSVRIWTAVIVISAVAVMIAGLTALNRQWSRVHQHCIEQIGPSLQRYAAVNAGLFPFHTNGYGDALGVWARFDSLVVSSLVGVDDDATWLKAAIATGANVDESNCTRIYVQGLSLTNNPQIAVLFDLYAVQGGDHFRGIRGQPYLREACLIDGSMQRISVDQWPAFASNQVELLVKEGIPRATAEAYYRPTLDPNAKR